MLLPSLQLVAQFLRWNCARVRGTEEVCYRLLHSRFSDFDFRREPALVASRQDYSLNRRAIPIGADYEQLNVVKGRAEIEKGVSSYYEAIWHRQRRLATLGKRHCTYIKQCENDYRWAHLRTSSGKIRFDVAEL